MLDPVQEAFLEWMETFPARYQSLCEYRHSITGELFSVPAHWDGDCPCPGGSAFHLMVEKDELGYPRLIPRPDLEVCQRERAWRKYTALRGNVPPISYRHCYQPTQVTQ